MNAVVPMFKLYVPKQRVLDYKNSQTDSICGPRIARLPPPILAVFRDQERYRIKSIWAPVDDRDFVTWTASENIQLRSFGKLKFIAKYDPQCDMQVTTYLILSILRFGLGKELKVLNYLLSLLHIQKQTSVFGENYNKVIFNIHKFNPLALGLLIVRIDWLMPASNRTVLLILIGFLLAWWHILLWRMKLLCCIHSNNVCQ